MNETKETLPTSDSQDDDLLTVDDYMKWVSTFDSLTPELRYIVLTQAGAKVVEGGSPALLKTHQLLVAYVRSECDDYSLSEQIKQANIRVYEKNKAAYWFAVFATITALCVAVYHFMKLPFNVF